MGQSQPTKPMRGEPRWARLLDDLDAVGHGAGGDGDPWRAGRPSPADARRAGQHGKALVGVTATVVAPVVAAFLLWQVTASGLRMLFRPEAPRGGQVQTAPVPATPAAKIAGAPSQSAAPVAASTVAASTVAASTVAPMVAPAPAAPAPAAGVASPPPATATAATATAAAARVATLAPTVPVRAAPVATGTTAGAAAGAAAVRAESGVQTPARVHVVERGDTLFSIARRNGTTVGELVAINGLASPDAVLSIGRRLTIPGP